MATSKKYDLILNALQQLLETNTIQNISVNDIASVAGIGKGSIYYYFSSKNEILEALVERSYKNSLDTARNLADASDIPVFTRMAMIFQACKNSSSTFIKQHETEMDDNGERAHIHNKYMKYLITELKPVLSSIIQQGISDGCINFNDPDSLAEIVLIVITVKLDNTLLPSNSDEIERVLKSMILLLEKGTDNPAGSLNFLSTQL